MPPADEQQTHGATTTTTTTATANLSQHDHEDIAAIEAAIDRMRAFTPTEPYVLTIPQDVEPRYHHSYAFQAKQWLHNTPFDCKEHENTQYQTFVYHEPNTDMYKLHISRAQESDENGDASVRRAGGGGGGGTGANTPMAGQPPKKTYSLSAYKKKQTGATPDASAVKEKEAEQTAKKPAVKGPVERIKADEEVLAAVDEDEDVLRKTAGEEEGKKDLKRKRGESLTNSDHVYQQKHEEQPVEEQEEEERTKKARRTSPPTHATKKESDPSAKSTQPTQPVKSPAKSQSHTSRPAEDASLPPKLSPPPAAPAPPPSSAETPLPPKLSPMDIPSLPSRLSPTLPTNITATLTARAHYRSASRSSEVSGPRSASKDPATRHFTPPPKTVPRNAFRANSSSPAVRSDPEERGRAAAAATSVPPRPKTPDALDSDEIPVGKKAERVKRQRESVSGQGSGAGQQQQKKRLLVKLKFKKAAREGVKRILKMRPNPTKDPQYAIKQQDDDDHDEEEGDGDDVKVERRQSRSSSDMRHRARRDTNAKGVAQKVGPTTATATNGIAKREEAVKSTTPPERRRARSDETDESDAARKKRKRKAVPDAIDPKRQEPSTPAASDLLSPSSAQKSTSQQQQNQQQLTPSTMRKDVLSAAVMKREQSNDSRFNNGNNHDTPPAMSQNSPTVNGTPSQQQQQQSGQNGAGAGGRSSSSSNNQQPSNKTPKQQAWESEQKRLETLGRELKHAASDHLRQISHSQDPTTDAVVAPSSSSNEQKLAAIKSLESLLAYMLAFTCADEAALAADPKLNPSAKPWRTLHGFFGFVKRHCEPFPALLGLACWLGVVFNARILELATTLAGADAGPSRESILETQAMMRRAAHEAEARLDVDVLREVFPRAWEGRFRGGGGAGAGAGAGGDKEERIEVGKGFAGVYKLPLGLQTSPLRGVRAGRAMLGEWLEREGGEEGLYVLRLGL